MALAAIAVGIFLWIVRPALDSKRWSFATDLSRESLVWGGLSVLLLVALFRNSPHLIPIFIVGVMVHEYGHVLAYRLAGHRAPKFRLVPFGGVAISDQAPQSQAENAFVALMGPGFSVILVVIAITASHWLEAAGDFNGAYYALEAAMWIGLLNAFNLLPFYPLDGGKTLHSVAMSGGEKVGAFAAIAMSGAFAVFAVYTQLWLLLIFALFGLLAATRPHPSDATATRMGLGVALLALGAYVATFAAHVVAALPFLELIALRAQGVDG